MDIKGRPFNFYLNDGTLYFKTFAGGIASLVLGVLLIAYSLSLFLNFLAREDYNILTSQKGNAISTNDSFGREQNFVVAAGLSGSDKLDDPEIG